MFTFTKSRRSALFATAVAAIALGAAGTAHGTDDPPATQSPDASAQTSKVVPLNSGVETSLFRSDASRVTLEQRADGTRIYHLNGQGMQSVVAHINEDGKLEYTCTDKVEQALATQPAENVHEQ